VTEDDVDVEGVDDIDEESFDADPNQYGTGWRRAGNFACALAGEFARRGKANVKARMHPRLWDAISLPTLATVGLTTTAVKVGITATATTVKVGAKVATGTGRAATTAVKAAVRPPIAVAKYSWAVHTGQRPWIRDHVGAEASDIVDEAFAAENDCDAEPPGIENEDPDVVGELPRKLREDHRLARRNQLSREYGGYVAKMVRRAKAKWPNLHEKDTPAMRSTVASYIRKKAYSEIDEKDIREAWLAKTLAVAVALAFVPNEAELVASRIPLLFQVRRRHGMLGEQTWRDVVWRALGYESSQPTRPAH
jgi:hypothetical protein